MLAAIAVTVLPDSIESEPEPARHSSGAGAGSFTGPAEPSGAMIAVTEESRWPICVS
jgi:hypothetical protein